MGKATSVLMELLTLFAALATVEWIRDKSKKNKKRDKVIPF